MAKRENYDSDVTITGTSSADIIHNYGGNNVSINAGAGNDSVTVEGGHNVTVSGGKGNDFVRHEWGVGVAYVYTSGNDTLENFHDFDSLVIADAWTSQRSDDTTVIITVKNKGTITLTEAYSLPTIVSSLKDVKHYNLHWNDGSRTFTGTSGNDYMWNDGDKVKVNGLAGDDYIETNNSQVTIDAGAGDDFVGSWRGSNNLIKLGAGNDIFQAGTGNYTVDGGTGNDTIRTWDETSNISVNGGAGDDYFHNNAHKTTIIGGDGNDFVGNWGSNAHHVMIDGGSGADTLENGTSSDVTLEGGEGDDYISNWDTNSQRAKIDGGAGNDTVDNYGSRVTINGGAGNDNLSNGGSNSSIDGGKGNDYIFSHAGSSNVTINAGTGNDTVRNHSANTFIESGNGDDSIYMHEHMDWNDETQTWDYVSSPDNVTINAGSGNDTIINNIYAYRAGENVSINAGNGNDYISNWGFNATILGGKGDDTVYNSEAGMVYVYKSGDGNDYISGFGILETLVVDDAEYSTVKSGYDVLVKVGKNTITLNGAASLAKVNIATSTKGIIPVNVVENSTEKKTIKGKASSNWIRNYADKVTINSGASTDDIYNSGSNVVIKGGGGYDQIRSYASDVSIQGGAQSDKIISANGDNVSIDAGKGNDVIDVYQGVNLLVRGGKGNDTVNLNNAFGWNGRYIFTYAKGDGKDVISKGAIINLIDGATIAQTLTSGSDTVLKIDSGSVTVKNTKPEDIIVVKDNDYSPYLIDVLRNKAQGKVIGKSSKTATQKIRNYGETSTIIGGKGIDSIYNEASSSSINAGAGDDYLQIGDYNISGVTALGGTGNDTIYNNGKNASIDAGTGNDTIISEGNSENVTIDGGKGHDVIEVQGIDYLVRGGLGNDTVNLSLARNNTEYVFEYAKGDGNDVVSKGAIISLIDGAKVDKMTKIGSDTVLKIGSGSITVKDTKPADVEIMTDGNYEPYFGYDEVSNYTPGQVVKIENPVHRKSKIQNSADNSTIEGGAGSDTINSWGANVSINAGDGNNYIYSYSTNGTIIAGAGDDSVYTTNNDNDKNYIDLGGGANYIYNNGTNTTIKSGSTIGDTVYTCPNSANNVIICGDGPNTIEVNGSHSTVKGGNKKDYILVHGKGSSADGNDDDDYIFNAPEIDPEKFKEAFSQSPDVILNKFLEAAEKDPVLKSILEDGINSKYLEELDRNQAKKIVEAVKDSYDLAKEAKRLKEYGTETEYRDFILNAGSVITDHYGTVDSINTLLKGAKDISTTGSAASLGIALFGLAVSVAAYAEACNDFNKKNPEAYQKAWAEVGGVNKQDFLNPGNILDKCIDVLHIARAEDPDSFDRIQLNSIDVACGFIASLGTIDAILIGLIFGNKPGAIFGLSVGIGILAERNGLRASYLAKVRPDEYTMKQAFWEQTLGVGMGGPFEKAKSAKAVRDIIRNLTYDAKNAGAVSNENLLNFAYENTIGTLRGGTGDDTIFNMYDNTLIETNEGNDVVINMSDFVKMTLTEGENFAENDGDNVSISGGSGGDIILNTGDNVTINSDSGDDLIENFEGVNIRIRAGDGNDYIENYADSNVLDGGGGNDILDVLGDANTVTGGVGNDIVNLKGSTNTVIKYTTGDDNDTIYGFNKTSKLQLGNGKGTYSTVVSEADIIVTVGKGKITLDSAANLSALNINGTDIMSLTLNNKSAAKVTLESPIKKADASARTSAIRIVGNEFNNSIVGGSKNDSLYGGNGNDYLSGGKGNDKIYGQNGADSLLGGSGNDTLTGGKGNDIFIYNAGNDIIADYTVGQDKIQIASGKISKTSLSGSDVLFTIGKGSLTVKNAKGKTISLIDSAGKASSTLVGSQALTNSNKASVTIGADMGAVDASARTKAILITGNALANTICGGTKNDSIFGAAGNDSILGNAGNDKLYGDAGNDIIYGGKGNDSLWGGVGNDSLWGDAGNDTFFYTANEGTDKIFDYVTGDMLKILNADGSDDSFKSSKFSGGDLTLTINGGGKIIFDDVASNTKFNINGSSYSISGSKLLKK